MNYLLINSIKREECEKHRRGRKCFHFIEIITEDGKCLETKRKADDMTTGPVQGRTLITT